MRLKPKDRSILAALQFFQLMIHVLFWRLVVNQGQHAPHLPEGRVHHAGVQTAEIGSRLNHGPAKGFMDWAH